ncbi:MAG TPA: N-acetyltransferase [Pyrinomonadaceae bacterium]|nr:N-acetyltransferase [Pyrinomonadaceae bacterium]
MFEIREELPADIPAIRNVNQQAFGQDQEGRIVDALRANGAALLSLVAVVDGQVVGHIMYSPASIGEVSGAGLAPMAVLPEYQRQGIGSQLVETGNQKLKASGCPFIVVLGHAEFYPRFGFQPASNFGLKCEWPVPDNVFMALIFDQQKMNGVTGLVQYSHEFSTIS